MITNRKETRLYQHEEHGKTLTTKVVYSLVFDGKTLIRVLNEHDSIIEKDSECWEYFNQKYNI